MAYEQQPGKTNLFRNDRKQQETHADWQATVLLDGREYYINGWEKQGSRGMFISLSFKERLTKSQTASNDGFADDDVGF